MSWGNQKALYELKSSTKSIGSIALGLALDDGLIELDDTILEHMSGIEALPAGDSESDWLGRITVRQLATHTAGFDKSGGYGTLLFQPGSAWSYSDGGTNWLADLLTHLYGEDLYDLLFRRVFSKIGIQRSDLEWRANVHRDRDLGGVRRREFGSGIRANVGAMARIGQLFLQRGQWRNEAILPASFAASVGDTPQQIVGLPVLGGGPLDALPDHYGLLWWNNEDCTLPDVPTDAFWSWGLKESLIVVIPSLDIVAVRAGDGWRKGWNPDYSVIEPFIVPIVRSVSEQSGSIPERLGGSKAGIVAAGPEDVRCPKLEVRRPSRGATVAGEIEVEVAPFDDTAVESVAVSLNGKELARIEEAPWAFDWNTDVETPGAHRLRVSAADTSGNRTTQSIELYLDPRNAYLFPYPKSSVITGLEWAPVESISRVAAGSDNWPVAWGPDDNLYTAFGDGWGFGSEATPKLSLGYAVVSGSPPDIQGRNIPSPTGEFLGEGRRGKKSSSMLSIDGRLYQWVRNSNNDGEGCELGRSDDLARTWQWSDWRFAEFGFCVFASFGRDYSGSRDAYVYVYSPDTPSAYAETDDLVLIRVPAHRQFIRAEYEFFAGFDGADGPKWDPDVGRRQPVFSFAGGVNRLHVSYHPQSKRYLLFLRSRRQSEGRNQFSIFEGPEPWGPWAVVYYTESWNGAPLDAGSGGWGESQHMPVKWIGQDGRDFWLIFSGDDALSMRRGRFSVAGI